jgi:hypothetical protein
VKGSRAVLWCLVGVLVLMPVLVFASHLPTDGTPTGHGKQQLGRYHMRMRTVWRNLTGALEPEMARPLLPVLRHVCADERILRPSLVSSTIFVPPRG